MPKVKPIDLLHSSNRIVNEIYNGKELVFFTVGSSTDSILLGNWMGTNRQQGVCVTPTEVARSYKEAALNVVLGSALSTVWSYFVCLLA